MVGHGLGAHPERGGRRSQRWRALLVVALASLGFLVALAAPASAHATLLSSDPADGTSLAAAPATVTLRFSEHVQVDPDAVRVVNESGGRVDMADAHTVGAGDTVMAGLHGALATGTYLVSWHVISADTHPVSGGFNFGVGVVPAAYRAAGVGVSGLDVVGAAGRTLVYAGLVLAVGVGAFLAAVWPAGRSRRRYRRLLGWGLVLLATGTVAEFLVQAAAGVGGGLGALLRPSLLADTAGSYLGHLLALRLLLVGKAAIALRSRTWASLTRPELALLGVGLAGTVGLAGHAHSGSSQLLAGVSATLHVLAMAVWLGGLTVLVVATWRRHVDPSTEQTLTAAMPRWSRVAQAAVLVLLVTGGYQAWREVRSFEAVAPTTYGNLLVVKVALFSLMIGGAFVSYQLLRRHYTDAAADAYAPGVTSGAGHGPPELRLLPTLRKSVRLEVLAGCLVLLVTSVLVSRPPAKDAYAPAFTDKAPAGPFTAEVTVKQTHIGVETIDLRLVDAVTAAPVAAQGAVGELSLPDRQLGPFTVRMRATGETGGFRGRAAVTTTGSWMLRFTIQVDELTAYVTTSYYTVR